MRFASLVSKPVGTNTSSVGLTTLHNAGVVTTPKGLISHQRFDSELRVLLLHESQLPFIAK